MLTTNDNVTGSEARWTQAFSDCCQVIRIGVVPNTELFRGQVQLDGQQYVLINHEQETSISLVFAVGDVSNPLAPTISNAVGAAKVIAARVRNGRSLH